MCGGGPPGWPPGPMLPGPMLPGPMLPKSPGGGPNRPSGGGGPPGPSQPAGGCPLGPRPVGDAHPASAATPPPIPTIAPSESIRRRSMFMRSIRVRSAWRPSRSCLSMRSSSAGDPCRTMGIPSSGACRSAVANCRGS
ncbi:MAG: hypothetical protein E2586_10000 [Novosphingobium sp.]|nr:hypothetical protein [Novosphingobium sp.]